MIKDNNKLTITNENNENKKIEAEIKGFPELSENVYKLYDQDKTRIRFLSNKELLRVLMNPKYVNNLRILLSMVNLNKIDYFKQLREMKFFGNPLTDFVMKDLNTNNVFGLITSTIDKTGKFPSMQWIVNILELPYDKDFFDEYLFNEEDLRYEINQKINLYIKNCYKQLSYQLKDYSDDITPILNTIIHINRKFKFIEQQDLDDNTFDNLEEFINKKKEDVILSTGIKELDEKNVKLAKGKISTLFAYTGSFKTMFCTNVAYNIINNHGNVLYISLEICKEEMYINFLSRHSYSFNKKISHSDIKNNQINDEEKKFLFKKIHPDFKDKLLNHLIVYDETNINQNTYANFNLLFRNAEKQFVEKTGHSVDLIIIDHLNLLKFGNKNAQNDYSAVNHWMSFFRKKCICFLEENNQVAFLCSCQSSREGYKKAKGKKEYDLTCIAEGNEIERSSQYVLSILSLDEDRKKNIVKMQVLKSRDNEPLKELIKINIVAKYYLFGVENKTKVEKDKYDNINNDKNVTEIFNNNTIPNSKKEVVVKDVKE